MSGLLCIVLTRVLGNPNSCPYACTESTLQTEPAPQPQGRALAGSPSFRAALAEQEALWLRVLAQLLEALGHFL